MEHAKFRTDDNALVEFLTQNNIPAIQSSKAPPGFLHRWEFEKIERLTDVAILDGLFFLAVTKQGFSLYVNNAQNDWYNIVRHWKSEVPEAEFLEDLQFIILSAGDNI